MYVSNTGRPSIVDGRRISWGDISRDEGKRIRLAAPVTKAIALDKEEIQGKAAPKKHKPAPILHKWGLSKNLSSNKNKDPRNNSDGKMKVDALKSISTDANSSSVVPRKRKMPYTKSMKSEAKADKIARFKQAYAAKEARSELDAKRRRIVASLAKQSIQTEFKDAQQQKTPKVSNYGRVATREAYMCTTVSSSALKLRLTKDGEASSRKRKLQ